MSKPDTGLVLGSLQDSQARHCLVPTLEFVGWLKSASNFHLGWEDRVKKAFGLGDTQLTIQAHLTCVINVSVVGTTKH